MSLSVIEVARPAATHLLMVPLSRTGATALRIKDFACVSESIVILFKNRVTSQCSLLLFTRLVQHCFRLSCVLCWVFLDPLDRPRLCLPCNVAVRNGGGSRRVTDDVIVRPGLAPPAEPQSCMGHADSLELTVTLRPSSQRSVDSFLTIEAGRMESFEKVDRQWSGTVGGQSRALFGSHVAVQQVAM
jgi:hypothetical protein